MADAQGLGPCARKGVWVRLPPPTPHYFIYVSMNQLLVALSGPTASGKTDWALRLAREYNGAIIAADSRTVYRGLDIGTNKPTAEYEYSQSDSQLGPIYTIQSVDHYGFDLAEPSTVFTASDFQQFAHRALKEIWLAGKLPILVGGTGLYVDAVLRGFAFPKKYELPDVWREQSIEQLAQELLQRDPDATDIDLSNRVRVERALAYVLGAQQPWSAARRVRRAPEFLSQLLVADRPRTELYQRIDAKIDWWFEHGLLAEVEGLIARGLTRQQCGRFGSVYRLTYEHVTGSISKQECRKQLRGELHALARRQLTWWRRHSDVQRVTSYTDCVRRLSCWPPLVRSELSV